MRQMNLWLTMAAILSVVAMVLMLPAGAVAASSSKVLYKFKGGNDAGHPFDGLLFDTVGNLYGTTSQGGGICDGIPCGTVFKLTPNSDGTWKETVLHRFKGGSDGEMPYAGLIFDAAGNLYGTTSGGGSSRGGTAFGLTPNSDGSWTESVLYSFCQLTNCVDGNAPLAGLTPDAAGNLYGTTNEGGASGGGTVFKLTPNSDGIWTETVLLSFNGHDGAHPQAGLIFDTAGNLYGSTMLAGGGGGGTVFKLTPNSDGTWKEQVLYAFRGGKDGFMPFARLTFDPAGNLYGTTYLGGGSSACQEGCGTVFKLAPKSNGGWKESVLHRFTKNDGATPYAGLTFDAAGNFYGATRNGGSSDDGVVFKLAPRQGGGWAYSVLNVFQGNPGINPYGDLIFDPAGNLYGTTWDCAVGQKCRGVVFEVTP